jgi:hypothetical protein
MPVNRGRPGEPFMELDPSGPDFERFNEMAKTTLGSLYEQTIMSRVFRRNTGSEREHLQRVLSKLNKVLVETQELDSTPEGKRSALALKLAFLSLYREDSIPE